MKTGDAEPDVLYLIETVKVKFKKSALRDNVAGKKLSPAHAVCILGYMFCLVSKPFFDRLVNNQRATFFNLSDKIPERSEYAFVISVNIEVIRISRRNDRCLRIQRQERAIKFISFNNHPHFIADLSLHNEIRVVIRCHATQERNHIHAGGV